MLIFDEKVKVIYRYVDSSFSYSYYNVMVKVNTH